jgi:hypothetical protein
VGLSTTRNRAPAFAALLPLLFWWSRRDAKKQTPRENGDTIEFFVTAGMRVMVRVVLSALLAFAALLAGTGPREPGTVYALLIPLTVFVLILLVSPVPVIVDRNGIRQGRWFLPEKGDCLEGYCFNRVRPKHWHSVCTFAEWWTEDSILGLPGGPQPVPA